MRTASTPHPRMLHSRGTASTPPVRKGAVSGVFRVAAFLALLGVCMVLLNALLDGATRRVTTGDIGVWNRIVRGDINAQVLVSGSSRAQTHYDPRLMSQQLGLSAFNIGLNGSQTDMQLARLKTYLRHNHAPRLLIHNMDAFAFQVSHGEVYDPGQYVAYLDEPDLRVALSRVSPELWKSQYLPLYGYAATDLRLGWLLGLREWLFGAKSDHLIDGFAPRTTAWTGDFERFRAANTNGVHVAIKPEGVREVEELLALCKSRGIQVVLVYSPEYREMQKMTSNREEILARIDAISRRYGATFIDYSDSPISARRDYFYNSQHLNATGAEAFTRDLASRLQTSVGIHRQPAPADKRS
jgi:hypothetical protein